MSAHCPTLVGSLASLWWHTVWRCDIDVHVIADIELSLEQSQIVVGVSLTGTSDSDLAHAIAGVGWLDECKIKVGSLPTRFRVYISHQSGQLLQGSILPGVDLEFVGWNVAMLVIGSGVMATGGAEDAQ